MWVGTGSEAGSGSEALPLCSAGLGLLPMKGWAGRVCDGVGFANGGVLRGASVGCAVPTVARVLLRLEQRPCMVGVPSRCWGPLRGMLLNLGSV
jgi:hypothetical protein